MLLGGVQRRDRVRKKMKKGCTVSGAPVQSVGAPVQSFESEGMVAVQSSDSEGMAAVQSSDSEGMAALSPAPAVTAFRDRLEKNKVVEAKFVATSRDASLTTVACVESFPTDADGNLVWPACAVSGEAMKRKIAQFLDYDQIYTGGQAQEVWPSLISAAYPWMQKLSLLDQLYTLVARVYFHRQSDRAWCDYIEFYCGLGNLSRAAIDGGLEGLSFDIACSSHHDVLTPHGLRLYLASIAATRSKALLWFGTPCSSFTIMCRGTSQRDASNQWLGNCCRSFVELGNAHCSVTGLLMLLGYLTDCDDVLEQSDSSCLPKVPPLNAVLIYMKAMRTLTYHGDFGGDSLKPLQLWASSSIMFEMSRTRSSGMCRSSLVVRDDETGAFTGVKDKLQSSQIYSIEFGRAVISSVKNHWRKSC